CLAFVPRRTDTEIGPPTGQHVQGSDGLDQNAGMTVDDAGHQGAQARPLRHAGKVAESTVALQHRFVSLTNNGDLEEVIHHPDAGKSGLVRSSANLGQAWPDFDG